MSLPDLCSRLSAFRISSRVQIMWVGARMPTPRAASKATVTYGVAQQINRMRPRRVMEIQPPLAMNLQGVLNIDKPAGVSSAHVVNRVKRLLPRGTKIGHAGTLDPFATGVLLLLVGKATKLCERLMDEPKQYEATVKLGSTTPTDDSEWEETPYPGASPVTEEAVRAAIMPLVGEIVQRPPAFSALKV